MNKRLLNIYFKLATFIFKSKNKMVHAEGIGKIFPLAIVVIVSEAVFAIVSLPIYIMVPPQKVQERGFIFPFPTKEEEGEEDSLRTYKVKRKVSLITFSSAGFFILLKIALVTLVSAYLLGVQPLLAITQNWTFTTAGNYTYDTSKIEVTGDVARLKDISSPASGSTVNSGFDSDATSWTYADWDEGPAEVDVTGTYQASIGNPGGWVDVNLPLGKGDELGGYWEQSFTTTADNPTVTVDFDWLVSAYAATPNTFQLYVFVDSASGAPTIGQEAWASGEMTSTQAWTSASTVDASAKVGVAGTYYLKLAVWLETSNSNTGPFTIGYDNAIASWSGVAVPSYASDRPTIEPTTSLNPTNVTTWDSFTETATKNGGEIYYQLSDDDGSTWQYWNGSIWTTAGASNYNTATVVNTNISSFSTTNDKIMWKAFLESDGAQQVIIDDLVIAYTVNDLPDITNITPVQSNSSSLVNIDYDVSDDESDPVSLATYEYSLTGAFAGEELTMTASTTDASHDGISGLTTSPTGVTSTFVWDAQTDVGNIYDASVYVRFMANDGIGNSPYASSTAFVVDYVVPVVSNVSASQVADTTNITITYDLADDTGTDLLVEIDISEDSGSTWTVTDTSVTGDVGAGQVTGTSKTIIWDAGVDFDEQQQGDLRVRVRAQDKYLNQGVNAESIDFSLDTLNPIVSVESDLQAQPNAGDTTVLISGSFTEINPKTNDFYLEINGAGYGSATAGDGNTATPSNQATAVEATLDGNDYISKVKIIHTDDFGQTVDNESTSPSISYKYIKPYTPQAPTLANPATTQLDLTINLHASETSGLEYLIQETSTGNYVQVDGTLGASEVWQTTVTWGTVNVNGLSSPLANYIFQVKSRNTSDATDATSSQSDYSATAQLTNTAPSISFDSTSQTTDGTQYTTIDYTGTDGQGDIVSLVAYEYSQDNSNWYTMTEKSSVGSDGISSLIFLSGGTAHDFMWDSGTDLSGVEDSTVYVRLQANDTLINGSLTTSAAFEVDNVSPITSSVSASQDAGARTVTISYILADANNSTVEIDISEDSGSTWTVTDTSVTGDVGAGIAAGSRSITWDAGADFDNQYQNDIRVRVRALDTFGNQGSNTESADFTLDTNDPSVSNVSGSQDSSVKTFIFNYDVSEDIGNVTIALEISSDGGSTWNVPITSASGDIGSGIVPETSKTITWDAATDYNGYEENDMQIRITATDQFSNAGNGTSSNFSLDTLAPRITSVSATQSGDVIISYDLADQNWSTIEIDISEDSGSTWTVTDTSVTGDVGSSIVSGAGKNITWDANTDFDEQGQSDMRVRVRGLDTFSNQSAYTESTDFSLDTVDPVTNVAADLQAQPNAGDTTVLIGGSFTETNPNTNNFYVEINNGGYSGATAGDTNTASPADQATAVEATLDGNDYISKVKITHTDDFGQTGDNENTSPSTNYKYVKPYTPQAPTVFNPTVGTVDVIINPHASEVASLEYTIYETTQAQYVQADGTLGASAVWQTTATWGTVTVSGLLNDSYTYQFQAKSRNSSDGANATSSESALSAGASSSNQSPQVAINSVSQTTDGTKYVSINYTGTDLENETASLVSYEYSVDNSNWYTMTEKSGVGSDGTSGLSFSSSGTTYNFMWDVGTDLNNTEDSTVYVRLQANDATSSGNITTSSAFTVDTKSPVISSLSGSQVTYSNSVTFSYTLSDLSNSTVELDISEDSGSTWTVTDTSVTGDVGSGITAGAGKEIAWDAGTDFNNQDQADMRVRVKALDTFGNQGLYTESVDFALDTADPVVSNVVAAQNSGASTVNITYDLADTNNSTVEIDISEDGGSTWTVTDTSVTGDIGSGVTSGTSKSITWDAGTDFSGQDQLDMRVRVRATDAFANGSSYSQSSNFSLDTLGPVIANVLASQTLSSDNVVFTYDLTDNSPVTIEIDISEDSGSTWTVTDTTITGDVGAGIAEGTGKSITWDAGTDFSGQDQVDMRVRIRGLDDFTNSSGNIESIDFTLDTLNPVINVTADLQAQPNAGDITVLIGGSFTETNPNTNDFYVGINGGAYSGATAGDTNTASPSNQATAVGVTLDGNDYISKVKITHVDDYTHSIDNENTSPSDQYVKPYTPQVPSVSNPQNTSVDILINPHASETAGLEYAIYESTSGNYVQGDGSLDTSAVWQTTVTWGTVTVTGLTSPVAQYSFQVKSRNTSDASNQASSESNLSSSAAISNTAPSISIDSAAQQTGGVNYVLINYTGTDAQNDTNSITSYEYSTDDSNWYTMTEKSGVGSDGLSGLLFTSTGASFNFTWDANTDLPGVEDSTVYIRLQSSDTLATSNLAQSSAFEIDNSGPAISNILVSQTPGTDNIVFEYDLSDNSGSDITIEIDISEDSGATWTVTDINVTGDVGTGVTAGASRSITWDAGTDFPDQEQSDMQVRIKGTDSYGNIGSFYESSDFTIDTATPVISNVVVSQSVGLSDVVVSYDLTDGSAGGHTVEFGVSEDSGSTWTVATSTVSGDIGAGQTTGSNTFTWGAGTDFTDEEQSDIRVRVRATDYYGSQGVFSESTDFAVDTANPIISNISAVQTSGTDNVVVSYDLADGNASNLTVEIDISNDGGSTWTVSDTSSTGDIGASQTTGTGKSITWDAGTDFSNQEQSDMRIRLRATDTFGNISIYYQSADFVVDTAAPIGLSSFSKFSETDTTVTLNWSGAVADANFNSYELWHGSSSDDVNNRTGTAIKWDEGDDVNLANASTIYTVITGLAISDNYYVKIFATDDFGNEATLDNINVYEATEPEPEPEPEPVITGGGGGIALVIKRVLKQPILSPLASPINSRIITISGLSEARSVIDLYDNGALKARLTSVVDNNGRFSEQFTFEEGEHVLTVIASDFSNNTSPISNQITLIVDLTSPDKPIVLSPASGDNIDSETPEFIGVSESLSQIHIFIDGIRHFITGADIDGAWSFIVPSETSLDDGQHSFVIYAEDLAGNIGSQLDFELVKVLIVPSPRPTPPTILPIVPPLIPSPEEVLPILPIPPEADISDIAEAVELPGIPTPSIIESNLELGENIFRFSGTALPNKDVAIYIHSDQALLYRTRTDANGVWSFDHSQDIVELTPGEHSIFAVTIDPVSKVKSRPSIVSSFVVEKSFWVTVFNLLNIQTTIVALIIILLTMFWLYKTRRKLQTV